MKYKIIALIFLVSSVLVAQATFNENGFINTGGDDTDADYYYHVAIQADGKVIAVGQTNGTEGLVARYTAAGKLDATFNGTGYINVEGGTNSYNYYGVAIQADGKIIAVGRTDADGDAHGLIARFNTDGSLDTTFNTTGYINVEGGTNSGHFYNVAIQTDGKIVVVGVTDDNAGLIVRYTSTGALDTTFNTTGYINTEDGTNSNWYYDVAIQTDGKIIAVGRTDTPNGLIVRYTSAGVLDTTFNGTGFIEEGDGDVNSNNYSGVALQADGKIVAVGGNGDNNGVIVRYNTDGTLDTTFNGTGYIDTEGETNSNFYSRVTVQNDGKIIAVGQADSGNGLIVRFNSDGTLDTTFNRTGYFINAEGGTNSNSYYGVALQPDGKAVVSGRSNGTSDGLITRYLANGVLDSNANWFVKNMQEHCKITNQPIGLLDKY